MLSTKFNLGRLLAMPTVLRIIPKHEWENALWRHIHGDWGDVDVVDWQRNEQALKTGERLFSAYHTSGNRKFNIITEADRSATTILLPQEY